MQAEVTIVRRSLLFAMGRADACSNVEDDHLRWAAVMNLVDPRPAHVGQDFNVRIGRQKFCLEAPHLAGGRSLSFDSFAADNPPHGRITSETVGMVVHVFVAAKAVQNRLTELPRHAMPSVLAGTAVLENSPGNLGQAKGIIKLPISEQPSVGSDLGAEILTSNGGQNRPEVRPVSIHPSGCAMANHSINISSYWFGV